MRYFKKYKNSLEELGKEFVKELRKRVAEKSVKILFRLLQKIPREHLMAAVEFLKDLV